MTEDDRFQYCVGKLLDLEGGYAHDPDDPGGETNFGISRRSYPDTDIFNLTRSEALEIYWRDFWAPNRYGEIADRWIAAKVFDLAVNMGAKKANRLLQIAVNQTAALSEIAMRDLHQIEMPSIYVTTRGPVLVNDGMIGPQTLKEVNTHPEPGFLLDRLKLLAVRHYLAIGRKKYTVGWVRRAIA